MKHWVFTTLPRRAFRNYPVLYQRGYSMCFLGAGYFFFSYGYNVTQSMRILLHNAAHRTRFVLLYISYYHFPYLLCVQNFGNYIIVLLHKKVTNCITFYGYFCVTFCHLSWACLLNNNNNKNKSHIFGNCKGPFIPKVKFTSLSLKEGPLRLPRNFSQHGTEEVSVNKCVTYLKK